MKSKNKSTSYFNEKKLSILKEKRKYKGKKLSICVISLAFLYSFSFLPKEAFASDEINLEVNQIHYNQDFKEELNEILGINFLKNYSEDGTLLKKESKNLEEETKDNIKNEEVKSEKNDKKEADNHETSDALENETEEKNTTETDEEESTESKSSDENKAKEEKSPKTQKLTNKNYKNKNVLKTKAKVKKVQTKTSKKDIIKTEIPKTVIAGENAKTGISSQIASIVTLFSTTAGLAFLRKKEK